jgi:hypothetical protein
MPRSAVGSREVASSHCLIILSVSPCVGDFDIAEFLTTATFATVWLVDLTYCLHINYYGNRGAKVTVGPQK